MPPTTKRINTVLLAVLITSIATQAVLAQAPDFSQQDAAGIFKTEFGDAYSSVFLNEIFGPLFPSVNGGGVKATVFSSVVGYFNIAMLTIGGILFLYNVTAGVLQTAHEGEILGKRWNSLWAPIRVILAVGLLMPVPNLGGYNTIQAGIAYVVRGSTVLASTIWTQAATLIVDGDLPVAGGIATFPVDIVKDAWGMASCIALANYQISAAGGSQLVQMSEVPDGLRVTLMTSIGESRARGICGALRTPEVPAYIEKLDPSVREETAKQFAMTHHTALSSLVAAMTKPAGEVLKASLERSGTYPDISGAIGSAMAASSKSLQEGIDEIIKDVVGADSNSGRARDQLKKFISGGENCQPGRAPSEGSEQCYAQGWIGAGSWYMMTARLNNELLSLTAAKPEVMVSPRYVASATGIAIDGNVNSRGMLSWASGNNLPLNVEEAGRISLDMQDQFDNATVSLAALGVPLTPAIVEAARPGESSLLDQIFSGLGDELGRRMTNEVVNFLGPNNWGNDPIIGLTHMGNIMMTAAILLTAAVAGAAIIPVAGGAAIAVAPILGPLIVALGTGGASLSFILPMMPFLFWNLAVTGYFLLVVEAVIAANLWAVAHLKMDGEGIAGDSARQGYLLLLSLLMTPVLMIFGFIVGMAIFRVTTGLLNMGFYYALTGLSGNLLVWLIGMAVMTFLMVLSYIVLIERSFSLVSEFPNRVLRWIGGSSQVANGEDRIRMAAVGAAASSGSGLAGTAGRAETAIQRFKEITAKKPTGSGKDGG